MSHSFGRFVGVRVGVARLVLGGLWALEWAWQSTEIGRGFWALEWAWHIAETRFVGVRVGVALY